MVSLVKNKLMIDYVLDELPANADKPFEGLKVALAITEHMQKIFKQVVEVESSIKKAQQADLAKSLDRLFSVLSSNPKEIADICSEKIEIPHRTLVIKDVSFTDKDTHKIIEKLFKKVQDINAEFVLVGRKFSRGGLPEIFELRLSWSKFNDFENVI